jgi:hypothetical protein
VLEVSVVPHFYMEQFTFFKVFLLFCRGKWAKSGPLILTDQSDCTIRVARTNSRVGTGNRGFDGKVIQADYIRLHLPLVCFSSHDKHVFLPLRSTL